MGRAWTQGNVIERKSVVRNTEHALPTLPKVDYIFGRSGQSLAFRILTNYIRDYPADEEWT